MKCQFLFARISQIPGTLNFRKEIIQLKAEKFTCVLWKYFLFELMIFRIPILEFILVAWNKCNE